MHFFIELISDLGICTLKLWKYVQTKHIKAPHIEKIINCPRAADFEIVFTFYVPPGTEQAKQKRICTAAEQAF